MLSSSLCVFAPCVCSSPIHSLTHSIGPVPVAYPIITCNTGSSMYVHVVLWPGGVNQSAMSTWIKYEYNQFIKCAVKFNILEYNQNHLLIKTNHSSHHYNIERQIKQAQPFIESRQLSRHLIRMRVFLNRPPPHPFPPTRPPPPPPTPPRTPCR